MTNGTLGSIDAEQKVMSAFPILIACVSLMMIKLGMKALKMVERKIYHDALRGYRSYRHDQKSFQTDLAALRLGGGLPMKYGEARPLQP
jgi:hypothetical protein